MVYGFADPIRYAGRQLYLGLYIEQHVQGRFWLGNGPISGLSFSRAARGSGLVDSVVAGSNYQRRKSKEGLSGCHKYLSPPIPLVPPSAGNCRTNREISRSPKGNKEGSSPKCRAVSSPLSFSRGPVAAAPRQIKRVHVFRAYKKGYNRPLLLLSSFFCIVPSIGPPRATKGGEQAFLLLFVAVAMLYIARTGGVLKNRACRRTLPGVGHSSP